MGLDLTNALNANPVLTYNEAFSTTTNTWLRPNSVLQPLSREVQRAVQLLIPRGGPARARSHSGRREGRTLGSALLRFSLKAHSRTEPGMNHADCAS